MVSFKRLNSDLLWWLQLIWLQLLGLQILPQQKLLNPCNLPDHADPLVSHFLTDSAEIPLLIRQLSLGNFYLRLGFLLVNKLNHLAKESTKHTLMLHFDASLQIPTTSTKFLRSEGTYNHQSEFIAVLNQSKLTFWNDTKIMCHLQML